MANTFAITSPMHAIQPITRHVGAVPFTMTLSETYATASGGIPITAASLEAMLATQGPENAIRAEDIIHMIGISTLGWQARFLKVADYSWTVELWNGITEAADGATTATITGLLFFSAGAQQ